MELWTWFGFGAIIAILLWILGSAYNIGGDDGCAVLGIVLTFVFGSITVVLFIITCSLKSNDSTNFEGLKHSETIIIGLYNSIKDTSYNEKNAIIFTSLDEKVSVYNGTLSNCIENRRGLHINYSEYLKFKEYYYNPYNNTLYADGILIE